MQTFLSYQSFRKSADSLDTKRLGKQRVEVLQLAQCIAYDQSGWRNHPATRMWRPYLDCLLHYGIVCCNVWQAKGFKDTVGLQLQMMLEVPYDEGMKNVAIPPWLGSRKLHSSHRSNLLRKDPVFYGSFGWKENPYQDYFWPEPDYNWREDASDCSDEETHATA